MLDCEMIKEELSELAGRVDDSLQELGKIRTRCLEQQADPGLLQVIDGANAAANVLQRVMDILNSAIEEIASIDGKAKVKQIA
ncbi:MAG TPA: hypothetical protein VNL14_16480 [Candidatus Acidoferrales bacterium]|nr:hypothetical protein [Candidatus Acidoferrales bacterium]